MTLKYYLPFSLFIGLCVAFLLALFGGDPNHIPTALEGKPVPQFNVPTFETGSTLTAQDFQSGETVLLNIWASWCAPCRLEHALLMQLAQNDIVIYGLNYKDTPQAARRFLHSLGNPYRKSGIDRDGRLTIELGVYGVPETFIISGAGKIIYKHVGPLTQQALSDDILPRLAKDEAK